MISKTQSIARIENNFIFNAQYNLTAREQKIMLFLISNINPLEATFEAQVISLKHLETIIMEKRSGSFYDEIIKFSSRISKKQIVFDSEIGIKKKKIKGIINWFQSILPVYNDEGELCLQFKFSTDLKPYLLELKEYAQIDYLDILPLTSSYSIRMFKVFKATRQRMSKHQQRSKIKYELSEFRYLLGIESKYKDWYKLRTQVLDLVVSEISKKTNIKVTYKPLKEGRSVVAVEFEFWNKGGKASALKLKNEISDLSFAQTKAFNNLVAYGVNSGIAMQMVSKEFGSEVRGFEDWYFEACIKEVELKSTLEVEGAKPGVLVNWFLKTKVFEQGDQFAKIMETLAARKKGLEKSSPEAWENRLVARGMTAGEFRERV